MRGRPGKGEGGRRRGGTGGKKEEKEMEEGKLWYE